MNKKIKQIAVFLGMLALGLTLTACSTNKDTKKATPKKPEKVSITYVQAPLNVPSIVERPINPLKKIQGKRHPRDLFHDYERS